MSDNTKQKKYGTHRRISDINFTRINAVGKMGDSVNKAIGMLLDNTEDINRCIAGDTPQTEKLRQLQFKWGEEAVAEYLINNSYNE